MLSHSFHRNYQRRHVEGAKAMYRPYTPGALDAAAKAVYDILILGVAPGFIALPQDDFAPYAAKIAKAALDAAHDWEQPE